MDLIAIDPAVNGSFAAWFEGGWPYRVEILDNTRAIISPPVGYTTVIEVPQVYQARYSKGDPNDLITLAFEAGRITALAGRGDLVLVRPAEWKGQTPKDVTEARMRAKYPHIDLSHIPKSKRHNAWDALGIGDWFLETGYRRLAV